MESDSSRVTFTICNTAIGSSVLLLSLINVNSGLLTFVVICIIIGLISGYCGDLTHLTSISTEKKSGSWYVTSLIHGFLLGRRWSYLYEVASFVLIWLGEIIYLLSLWQIQNYLISLSDALYGGVCYSLNLECPSQDDFTLSTFSYQWVGLGVVGCLGWTFFKKGLKEQMKYSAKGIFFILLESSFLIYLGISSWFEGKVKFSWSESETEATGSLSMVTDGGFANAAGVYAAAFIVHCFLVEYSRTNHNQANNSRDIKLAFYIIIVIYLISGFFGAMGLYYRPNALNGTANTVLSVTLYDRDEEPLTYYFAIICQFFAVIQLSLGLPPIVNVAKVQISTLVKEYQDSKRSSVKGQESALKSRETVKDQENAQAEDHNEPEIPDSVNIGVGIFFLSTALLFELFNFTPNLFMDLAGTFTGFVLVFLVPCYMYWIGLKRKQRAEQSPKLLNSDNNYVPELVAEMTPNYSKEYLIIAFVFIVGLFILAINLQTFINTLISDL